MESVEANEESEEANEEESATAYYRLRRKRRHSPAPTAFSIQPFQSLLDILALPPALSGSLSREPLDVESDDEVQILEDDDVQVVNESVDVDMSNVVDGPTDATEDRDAPADEAPRLTIYDPGAIDSSRCRAFKCTNSAYCILVLKKGASLDLFGAFQIQVLCGAIKLMEYRTIGQKYDKQRFLSVCAPICLGPPMKIKCCESKVPFKRVRVKYRSKQFVKNVYGVMEYFKPGDALILLHFSLAPAVSNVLSYNDVSTFVPSGRNLGDRAVRISQLCFAMRDEQPTLFSSAITDCMQLFVKTVQRKREEGLKTVVMVIGGKGAGKSTFARAFINALLQKNAPPVYLLDGDVGQSECNPSECVALTKIVSPLLGPPFCTQKSSFESAYFFGDVSVNNAQRRYLTLMKKLLTIFTQESEAASTLVINTLGWVTEGGIHILESIIAAANPNLVLNIISGSTENYDGKAFTEHEGVVIPLVITAAAGERLSYNVGVTITSAVRRNLLMKGYICDSFGMELPLLTLAPRRVAFNSFAIHFHPRVRKVPLQFSFAVLNCSFVALCAIEWDDDDDGNNDNRMKHMFGDEQMPWILPPEAYNEVRLRCFGFGFVRAIDIEARTLYVTTPVDPKFLPKVTALVRGVSDFSTQFLAEQNCSDAPYLIPRPKDPVLRNLFKPSSSLSSSRPL